MKSSIKIFPNPFHDNFNIVYHLNKESFVKIEIYDLVGKKITTLVDEKQKYKTYNYNFSFKMSKLYGGLYLLKIKTDDIVYYQKLLRVLK